MQERNNLECLNDFIASQMYINHVNLGSAELSLSFVSSEAAGGSLRIRCEAPCSIVALGELEA